MEHTRLRRQDSGTIHDHVFPNPLKELVQRIACNEHLTRGPHGAGFSSMVHDPWSMDATSEYQPTTSSGVSLENVEGSVVICLLSVMKRKISEKTINKEEINRIVVYTGL